ncbi:MAG: hypothetical protein IIC69_01410 [Nanoarchaeota archaeon]|nr:hypothetical protein [Nanoarchaeota archaeon]
MSERFSTIKSVLKQKKYFLIFLITTLIYLGIYYLIINYFLTSFSLFFTTYVKSYAYPAFILNIIVAILMGVNISLLIYRMKEFATDKKSSMMSGVGIFAAALANGCPGCFAGLFPVILSIFGISATLSILPFNGLELQGLSAVLLGASIFFLAGKTQNVCEIKK